MLGGLNHCLNSSFKDIDVPKFDLQRDIIKITNIKRNIISPYQTVQMTTYNSINVAASKNEQQMLDYLCYRIVTHINKSV